MAMASRCRAAPSPDPKDVKEVTGMHFDRTKLEEMSGRFQEGINDMPFFFVTTADRTARPSCFHTLSPLTCPH